MGCTVSAPETDWPSLDESIGVNLVFQVARLVGLPTEGQMADMLRWQRRNSYRFFQGLVHIRGSTIEPSVHIIDPPCRACAVIRHGAYIREFSWICDDALVGHASEVKHDVLLPIAKAPHFNTNSNSMVGPGVTLEQSPSNLRNDGGEVHTHIDGERLATGLESSVQYWVKVVNWAVAAANPGVVLGPRCMVMPNTTVTDNTPQIPQLGDHMLFDTDGIRGEVVDSLAVTKMLFRIW